MTQTVERPYFLAASRSVWGRERIVRGFFHRPRRSGAWFTRKKTYWKNYWKTYWNGILIFRHVSTTPISSFSQYNKSQEIFNTFFNNFFKKFLFLWITPQGKQSKYSNRGYSMWTVGTERVATRNLQTSSRHHKWKPPDGETRRYGHRRRRGSFGDPWEGWFTPPEWQIAHKLAASSVLANDPW